MYRPDRQIIGLLEETQAPVPPVESIGLGRAHRAHESATHARASCGELTHRAFGSSSRTRSRAIVLTLLVSQIARGQWLERSIQLQPGWNAVYLEIDPFPAEADLLFAGLPIESAWTLAEDTGAALRPACDGTSQDDPDCVPLDLGRWWVWAPPGSPDRPATNARLISGGRVYLLKATRSASFAVKGRPNSARTRWQPGLNLVGFHVDPDLAHRISFQAYLEPSAAHRSASVFSVSASGAPTAVANPSTSLVDPGEGYWVSSSGATTYDGPVAIDSGSLRGLDFAKSLTDHTVSLENLAGNPRNVLLRLIASAAPPPGQPASPVGELPMQRFAFGEVTAGDGGESPQFRWIPFSQASFPLAGAGESLSGEDAALLSVRLAVNRTGLTPAEVLPDGSGSEYQRLLEVTDGAGFWRVLPVSAQVAASGSTAGVSSPHLGLWVGHVAVDSVSWVLAGTSANPACDPTDPADAEDCDAVLPRPAATEFTFPIILHVGTDGVHRLLDEVAIMWRDAVPLTGGANCPSSEFGYYVLVTPECPRGVLDCLVPGSLRDGEAFSRRISTPAYALNPFAEFDLESGTCDPPDEPCAVLNGTLGLGAALSIDIHVPAENRLNPFKHHRHPDHDCDPPSECYELARQMTLTFAVEPTVETLRDRWGDTVLGGSYSEVVTGLHKFPIRAAGRFTVNKVAAIGRLNAD